MDIVKLSSVKDFNFSSNGLNNIYILIGHTDSFINNYITSELNKIEFYYIYEITVDDESVLNCSFITSNLLCPIKNKFNIKIYHDYKKVIGSCILNVDGKFFNYNEPDKLYVYVFCYWHDNRIRTTTMIKCCELLYPKENIVIDNFLIDDMSFFYTSPEIIKQHPILKNDITFYKNIVLRKEINRLIKRKSSDILCILKEKIITIEQDDIWQVVVEDSLYCSKDITRLINFDYDKDEFLSFVRAWYSGQLSNCPSDNEKIEEMYELIKKVI
ncbi:SWPV1-083 [Shearwaterpox virus]|uniref:SWPV1-083 n=1 Tax=Shearwaterpox virus TaxID=1974596 RepID=A0A1V0QGV2_CNPV|nr:SWPV1-083 [Shearwaterpox virus]